MDNEKAISVLNGLIETCKDGEQGFKAAAEGVPIRTRRCFNSFAAACRMARELQAEVAGSAAIREVRERRGRRSSGWINIKSP